MNYNSRPRAGANGLQIAHGCLTQLFNSRPMGAHDAEIIWETCMMPKLTPPCGGRTFYTKNKASTWKALTHATTVANKTVTL